MLFCVAIVCSLLLSCNVPLSTVTHFVYQQTDQSILGFLQALVSVSRAAGTTLAQGFGGHCMHCSWEYLGVGLLGHRTRVCLPLGETAGVF